MSDPMMPSNPVMPSNPAMPSNPVMPPRSVTGAATNPPRFEDRSIKANRRRRRGFTAVAAAAVVAVTFGASTLVPGSTPAAAAAVIEAAEQTKSADSGSMTVDFDITHDGERMTQQVDVQFDGNDVAARLGGDDGDAGLGLGDIEVAIVDDTTYARLGDAGWIELDDSPFAALSTAGLPADIRDAVSSRLITLVKDADDVVEISDKQYRATTTMADIAELTQVIPGFDPLELGDLPPEASEIPVDVDLTLDDDGYIDLVSVSFDGADLADVDLGDAEVDRAELEQLDITVAVDFEDLGADQAITAPADAQPFDMSGLGG